ncbi:hypothetical protein AAFC00_001682 [Neodothiora populina]|uniref:Uncharacterized protein n=1 Tax=Neodothiora populina TaxID=2781224 RepID=A0ABR3PPT4_9PEZI
MGLLALQAEVLEQIVVLYDTSIWHLARQIRTIEKIRTHDVQNPYSFDMKFPGEKRNNFLGPSAFPTLQDLSGSLSGEKTMATTVASVKSTQRRKKPLLGPSSFPKLHDLARHTAHSTETVHVAADILARILRQGERIEERSRPAREKQQEGLDLDAPLESLGFSHSILCSLTERSKSNEKRLSNEINLMFNLITQRDSKAVQNDSAAMKAIAVVTTLFLPATFLAAIFGMTFFDYSPPAGADDKTQATWSVAPQIWIYFALAAPLTLLSVMVGNFWLKRVDRQFSPAVGTSNPAVIATGLTSEEAVKISGAMPGEEEVEVKLRSLERGSSVARLNGSSMV